MSETKLNPTPGPWVVRNDYVDVWAEDSEVVVADVDGIGAIDLYDNAYLIAEAGTVFHETGLTPRQLADQRAELLAMCVRAEGWYVWWLEQNECDCSDFHFCGRTQRQEDLQLVRVAIANAVNKTP